MTTWCIAGDGWGRGEFPATAWRPPQWIQDPENHRHHRTSGVHPGVSQFILQDNPNDSVSVLAGFSQNNSSQIARVAQYCQWWREQLDDVRVIFFWSDPCRDYNPYNLWDENWHGVDTVEDNLYYILPTNRWEHTGPTEFESIITDWCTHYLSELNNIGIPVYMVGGSCSLPLDIISNYSNLIPCVLNARQLVWGDWQTGWYNPHHVLKAHQLYQNRVGNLNPVNSELLSWCSRQQPVNWYTPDNLHQWMPDGRHGGRQMHQMIWHQIQNHIKTI